jgi:hypothetical protein
MAANVFDGQNGQCCGITKFDPVSQVVLLKNFIGL